MLSKLVNILENLNACHKSIKWLSGVDNIQQAWGQCEKGDWLLWVLAKLEADRKKIVLSACVCARISLKFNSDERVLYAIETAEAWTRDEATLADLDRATWAARAAAWAAASEAAAWAAGAAAREDTLKQCADIVRLHFSLNEVSVLVKNYLSNLDKQV